MSLSTQPGRPAEAPAVFAAGHERVRFLQLIEEVRRAVREHVTGLDQAVDSLLVALFAGGHVLVESAPGLGKTTLAKVLAGALGLRFGRVQFTPDLMPFDILGCERPVDGGAGGRFALQFTPGPIFTSFLLADEINRAPPKTQAALLEAMAERQVTIASIGRRLPLPLPFFVLATQNPIEMEGTYELPEAQLDRFMFKVNIHLPAEELLVGLLAQQQDRHRHAPAVEPVVAKFLGLPAEGLDATASQLRHLADAAIAQLGEFPFRRELARLVRLTHLRRLSPTAPSGRGHPDFAGVPLALQQRVHQEISDGASPRAALDLLRAAQVLALFDNRAVADWRHIRRLAPEVLGHRLVLTFEGASLRRPSAMSRFIEELCDAVAPSS